MGSTTANISGLGERRASGRLLALMFDEVEESRRQEQISPEDCPARTSSARCCPQTHPGLQTQTPALWPPPPKDEGRPSITGIEDPPPVAVSEREELLRHQDHSRTRSPDLEKGPTEEQVYDKRKSSSSCIKADDKHIRKRHKISTDKEKKNRYNKNSSKKISSGTSSSSGEEGQDEEPQREKWSCKKKCCCCCTICCCSCFLIVVLVFMIVAIPWTSPFRRQLKLSHEVITITNLDAEITSLIPARSTTASPSSSEQLQALRAFFEKERIAREDTTSSAKTDAGNETNRRRGTTPDLLTFAERGTANGAAWSFAFGSPAEKTRLLETLLTQANIVGPGTEQADYSLLFTEPASPSRTTAAPSTTGVRFGVLYNKKAMGTPLLLDTQGRHIESEDLQVDYGAVCFPALRLVLVITRGSPAAVPEPNTVWQAISQDVAKALSSASAVQGSEIKRPEGYEELTELFPDFQFLVAGQQPHPAAMGSSQSQERSQIRENARRRELVTVSGGSVYEIDGASSKPGATLLAVQDQPASSTSAADVVEFTFAGAQMVAAPLSSKTRTSRIAGLHAASAEHPSKIAITAGPDMYRWATKETQEGVFSYQEERLPALAPSVPFSSRQTQYLDFLSPEQIGLDVLLPFAKATKESHNLFGSAINTTQKNSGQRDQMERFYGLSLLCNGYNARVRELRKGIRSKATDLSSADQERWSEYQAQAPTERKDAVPLEMAEPIFDRILREYGINGESEWLQPGTWKFLGPLTRYSPDNLLAGFVAIRYGCQTLRSRGSAQNCGPLQSLEDEIVVVIMGSYTGKADSQTNWKAAYQAATPVDLRKRSVATSTGTTAASSSSSVQQETSEEFPQFATGYLGLAQEAVDQIRAIVDKKKADGEINEIPKRVLISGHSLGASVASLVTVLLFKELPDARSAGNASGGVSKFDDIPDENVTTVTYAQPGTLYGKSVDQDFNDARVADLTKRNMLSVIADGDLIPTAARLFGYKRLGVDVIFKRGELQGWSASFTDRMQSIFGGGCCGVIKNTMREKVFGFMHWQVHYFEYARALRYAMQYRTNSLLRSSNLFMKNGLDRIAMATLVEAKITVIQE